MSFVTNEDRYDSGLVFVESEGVGRISFDPDGRAALDPILVMEDLQAILSEMRIAKTVKSIVISIGGDGVEFDTNVLSISGMSVETAEYFSILCTDVYRQLSTLHQTTIAAVDGDCFGMGLELILHCDLRVASQASRFGLTGINFGLAPNGSGLARLSQLIGESHARMMGLTGAMISADRSFVMGFVTNVLPEGDFKAGVNMLATHLASLSSVAIAETKKMLLVLPADQVGFLGKQSAKALGRCLEAETETREDTETVAALNVGREDATIH
jgi:enoyl-CoA hydratase/carnithine racemase